MTNMYAIVDIETTGSYAAANGITEISIQLSDGQSVTGQYNTLINPGQPIPPYISAMTGISNQMVATAPRFEEVAEKVYQLLQDRIFIAHNVSFDYSFVKSHLREAGFELNTKKLCTVRLSRKIIPGLPSYSLGKLSRSLGIEITDRHRATGDAAATARIFHLLLANDKEQHIQKSLQRNSKEWILPPNVPKEHFDALPYTPGVYYFHNEKGKVVYVGKATNIRYRVNSHFSNNSESRQKQNFMQHVYAISCQPCATELMACILESAEIKKRWPVFNSSQKRWEDIYGIFLYEDRRGYLRLAIDKNRKRLHPVYTFHYLVDGHAMIRKLIREYQLCPKLCFIQKGDDACEGLKSGECLGACELKESAKIYNERVEKACATLQAEPSFAIIDKGLEANDQSCILVCEGKFYGMGYLPENTRPTSVETLKSMLTQYRENSFIRNLVNGYAARFPDKVIYF
ncbi:MAG TPA: exonuclease domain-containing protein [Chitinophagaceae bacterium]|nr:exonuclease domain-containing protein [Chitinophagaceae bacterium]HRG91585.1 exonuclease domain-containing protein [Chitinophagaceae bacterium]